MFKKILAVGLSCATALVLMLSALATPASVSAVTLEQMANTAIECITSHEGSYGSINANDCGAVSVGKLQWHADRALALMRKTCELCPSFAEETLGSSFYNEIMSASSWSYRTFNSSEKAAASALLSSEYGIKAQDETALNDVQGYIITGQNKGITDPGALVLYADIYNFGCGIASRIAKRAASYTGSYASVTLDDMYKAAMNDSYGSNSAFVSRTKMVYNHILGLGWSDESVTDDNTVVTTTTTVAVDVEFTDDGAGLYTVNASALYMRSGPGTSYSIITKIPNSTTVTVTATSNNNWAAVDYSGYSGYCSMQYLVPVATAETTTTTAETTTTSSETTTVSSATTTTESTTASAEMTTTTTTSADTTAETTTTTKLAVSAPNGSDVIVNDAYASVYGDVNCDGSVSVADAILLHKYLVGVVHLNVEQIANSDCSYDAKLSDVDVTVIMQHLTGHYTALPIV